ncbi:hypothetical protein ABW20_dc0104783 [Dactylellina cionopaga]|nr:hypothetical protein ABW20_dc0104783 [Dactylellina cionopaga]
MPKPYAKPGAPLPAAHKSKKRKRDGNQLEEITFDRTARQEYLTGFHKRKLARIKAAQEEAEKRGREERIEARRKLREARKEDLRRHVEAVNQSLGLEKTEDDGESEEELDDESAIGGDRDTHDAVANGINEQEEFVEEDKFTTVTVTTMDDDDNEDEEENADPDEKGGSEAKNETKAPQKAKEKVKKPKVKKKKFRYLSKGERKDDRRKDKARRGKKKEERTSKGK